MSTEIAAVTLWRLVGPKELDAIRQPGMRAFPPRLPEQPIFYPVLSEAYAVKIARDWNTSPRRQDVPGSLPGPRGGGQRSSGVLDS